MRNAQLAPGSLFANRFEIQRAAGSGGMGTVYRAVDRYRGETVGLKLLHLGSTGSDDAERFAREAQLLSELRHSGIVGYVAHGETPEGQRYLAMEWLDGQDLGELLRRGPLSVQDCIRLLGQVADALSVAHQRGIIHRDLKPSNLFLVEGDIARVKILDFGIARRIATSHAMTKTGMIVGTPEYMAPEQARGSRELTPAVDLFSLGCVLYECLTGQPPFVADHIAAVLVRILFEEPTPLALACPGLPIALSEIVQRLLAKDPAQRTTDVTKLLADLASIEPFPTSVASATVAQAKPSHELFLDQEHRLFSIVLAASDEADIGLGSTQPRQVAMLGYSDPEALLKAIAGLGGSPSYLANGTLVVTVPPLESAQDQAALAARTALLIRDRWPDALISIATGRGAIRSRTAVGEVVDLAARLHTKATHCVTGTPRTGVLIDPLSAQLLEGRFAQVSQPGGAVLLQELHDADSRRLLLGQPTACMGRDAELGNLDAQFQSCRDDEEARAVLITAPPGTGKSRLRHEFLRRVVHRTEKVTILAGRGELMSAGAPFGILSQALRQLCEVKSDESLESQRNKIASRIWGLDRESEQRWVAEFVGEMCAVPFQDDGSGRLDLARADPRIMRSQVQRAFVKWLEAECAAAPVLLVLDDLQWGDGLSVALIDEVLRELRSAPLFILAFARPEIQTTFPGLWQGHKLQEIALKGLSKKACERLAQQVLGKHTPAEVIERIVSQSAGNAFFLEELIRSAAEGKTDQPQTVMAMLQARVGRFETGPRKTLLAASIFGQNFRREGAAALLGMPGNTSELDAWLATLLRQEMIEPSGSGQNSGRDFRFRHALVRDAAYGLLVDADRDLGHRMAAEFMSKSAQQDPLEIAEHYRLAQAPMQAVPYLMEAAERAFAQLDLEATLLRTTQAIACGATGPQRGAIRALQCQCYRFMGKSAEQIATGSEALESFPTGSTEWLSVVHLVASAQLFDGEQTKAFALIEQFLSVAPHPDKQGPLMEGTAVLLLYLAQTAQYSLAKAVRLRLKQTLSSYVPPPFIQGFVIAAESDYLRAFAANPYTQRQLQLEADRLLFPLGAKIQALSFRAFAAQALSDLGANSDAIAELRNCQLVLDTHRLTQYLKNLVQIHLIACLARDPRHHAEAEQLAKQMIGSTTASAGYRGWAHASLVQVSLQRQDLSQAEQHARTAISLSQHVPLRRLQAQSLLAEALLGQGRGAESLDLVERTFLEATERGGGGYAAVRIRLILARARQRSGNQAGAVAALAQALEEINRQASLIPDTALRSQFLSEVSEVRQTLELQQTL